MCRAYWGGKGMQADLAEAARRSASERLARGPPESVRRLRAVRPVTKRDHFWRRPYVGRRKGYSMARKKAPKALSPEPTMAVVLVEGAATARCYVGKDETIG